MTNKEKYIKFCKEESGVPIFSQYWWLDTVCGEANWDVCLVEKGGHIYGSLPFYKTKQVVFDIIKMPKLTQSMGVYIKYPQKQKYYKKISWEKEIISQLIEQLPQVDYFSQNLNKSISNWLPFYWKGYHQTTKYTYTIENISLETLDKNLETDIRRRRKKAIQLGIEVIESNDIESFYKLNEMTFKRKGKKIPYSLEFVKSLYEKCIKFNACKLLVAKNSQNEFLAGSFLVYDDITVYYLMGGIDTDKRDQGAMDLVQFESIKFALEDKKVFDFEGSMIESIEKYFRSFGSIQRQYFNISKTNSKLLKIRAFLKEL